MYGPMGPMMNGWDEMWHWMWQVTMVGGLLMMTLTALTLLLVVFVVALIIGRRGSKARKAA
jgi:hypothetical protein